MAAEMQAKKTSEGMAIKNLEFRRIIRKIIQRLNNEDLEQQNNIVSLWSSIGLLVFVLRLFKGGAGNFPDNGFVYLGKGSPCLSIL